MEDVVESRLFSFPKEEEATQAYWESINAFEEQLKRSEGRPEYIFFDGPPFATGMPHYGHLLAGTIKDIVTRYASQTGHHVTRRFGWDCHGLPVEYEIDKKLNIKTRQDVMDMGIGKYNEECRSIVMRYSKEWEAIVTRMGRWIDFENDYKTLDVSFMESVWWVFRQLWDKGLVYKGFKVREWHFLYFVSWLWLLLWLWLLFDRLPRRGNSDEQAIHISDTSCMSDWAGAQSR
jgi:isoleucyl-tRNA synthetase